MRRSKIVSGGLFVLALGFAAGSSGCAVGPNYERPKIEAPKAYRGAKETADKVSLSDLPWWKVFADPTMQGLLKDALERSYDIRIAVATVDAYRSAYDAAKWSLFPTFGGAVGGGARYGFPGTPTFFPPSDMTGHWTASAGASWELDVWGRLRRQMEAADGELQASEQDLRGVYVSLLADVANAYFLLRTYDLQLDYAKKALGIRESTRDFFKSRMLGGVSNDLEVARAEANVHDATAQIAALERSIVAAENRLSILLARPPGPIKRGVELMALPVAPDVPPGLPSTILERRPDVRSAEERLRAANARVGATLAEFFPKFDLTGFLGVVTTDLTKLATAGASDAMYGANGIMSWTAPILGGSKIAAAHAQAKAAWRASVAYYERATLNAFREVADALVSIERLREGVAARKEQVSALERAEATASGRYKGGVSTYLDLLTAQEQLLGAQLALAQLEGDRRSAVVNLYRALGGGWSAMDAKSTP